MTPYRIKEILNVALKSPIIKKRFPMIETIYITDVREKHLTPNNYVIQIKLKYDKDQGFNFDTKEEFREKIYELLDTLELGGPYSGVYIEEYESK